MIWLDRDMRWHGAPVGKRGRTPTFSDAAIQFCLTIKCLFNLTLRQAVGMEQSLLRLAGLDWPTPGYSTVCRRQKHRQVVIPCRPATTGLHLLNVKLPQQHLSQRIKRLLFLKFKNQEQ